MKAVLCREFGPIERLAVDDLPSPVAGAGQVVIKVAAAGVNFPDALLVQGKYQLKPPLPFSPGGEFAGTVKEVGAGVTHVAPGDAVVGIASHGGYAEEALVDAHAAIPLPGGTDPALAAVLMVAHGTALHALEDRAALARGETLLVLGAAGGVGLAAVEIGKLLGARVIACASTPEKLAVCRARGADEIIDYSREDLRARLSALTGGRGVDVVYDSVGATTFEKGLDVLAPRGMMALYGQSSGPAAPFDPQLLNAKGSLFLTRPSLGHYVATREELLRRAGDVLGWVRDGSLRLRIGAEFPLGSAADAHRALEGRKTTGKVLLIP